MINCFISFVQSSLHAQLLFDNFQNVISFVQCSSAMQWNYIGFNVCFGMFCMACYFDIRIAMRYMHIYFILHSTCCLVVYVNVYFNGPHQILYILLRFVSIFCCFHLWGIYHFFHSRCRFYFRFFIFVFCLSTCYFYSINDIYYTVYSLTLSHTLVLIKQMVEMKMTLILCMLFSSSGFILLL